MKKKFVYFKGKDQQGFFLIEHMIALFLTSLLTLVAIFLLQVVKSYHVNANQVSQHEIETLTTRLQKEVMGAKSFDFSQNRLIIHFEHASSVTYHVQNNRLTRQVNGVGGEIALYHCKKIFVTLINDQSVKIELTSSFDDIFYFYLSTLTPSLPISIPEEDV